MHLHPSPLNLPAQNAWLLTDAWLVSGKSLEVFSLLVLVLGSHLVMLSVTPDCAQGLLLAVLVGPQRIEPRLAIYKASILPSSRGPQTF